MEDRSWMYRRKNRDGFLTPEFLEGVTRFLNFAFSNLDYVSGDKIRCPCSRCENQEFHTYDDVHIHLLSKGFTDMYLNWTSHGERVIPHEVTMAFVASSSSSNAYEPQSQNFGNYTGMVMDAMPIHDPYFYPGFINMDGEEEPNPEAAKFFQLLKDADEPLYDGCTTQTKLSSVARFLSIKTKLQISEFGYDMLTDYIKDCLPDGDKHVENYYQARKLMKPLGLSYEKIHMCPNFCMLYYGDNAEKIRCNVCGHNRYKPCTPSRNRVPYKILRYFPITPRLQRLFMSSKTADHMMWHANHHTENGTMAHPSDGLAWKEFNKIHPDFSSEPRNVRLGLCTDGFNPFGLSSTKYSCWPVIITIYNLPPGMCMKREFMFLSLVIPGPDNPKHNIDVCLRPLIDELKMLWNEGVLTYDVSRKQNFVLRAALLWTINDFPAYGMLSGWSTHGKLACPYCMGDTKAFRLKHGGKPCWFDCHHRFLPRNHSYWLKRNDFLKNRIECCGPPPLLNGQLVMNHVYANAGDLCFGFKVARRKFPGFGEIHNWVKISIFWELPYWSTNLVRHCLDLMHIEKNVFDNIFNTVMDVPGKTKDNFKARLDLAELCNRKDYELCSDHCGRILKPKAPYTLDKDFRILLLQWISSLRFPDGYASNISRCVNLQECRMQGMKSHDCHVFMQRLLPIAFRDLLPKGVSEAITELSNFFHDISSHVLREENLDKLESSIVETICKLERIFPPSFFDCMEHLTIHLPFQAKLCGPPQYVWMYPFERYLFFLKKKVRNKAQVEGSISEAYLIEEISNFTSFYFEPNVRAQLNRIARNDDGGEIVRRNGLSIFCFPGRPLTRKEDGCRYLGDIEKRIAHNYVLFNCQEIKQLAIEHYHLVASQYPNTSQDVIWRRHEEEFSSWFKTHVRNLGENAGNLTYLAAGPQTKVKYYHGYVFHTEAYGMHKKTYNSGVCVKGTNYGQDEIDYYGVLEEVIELRYHLHENRIVLFKCRWFDPNRGVVTNKRIGLVEIKKSCVLPEDDVFVFASQCLQVYYTDIPSKNKERRGWWSVVKTKARNRIEIPQLDICEDNEADVFQAEGMSNVAEMEALVELEDASVQVIHGAFDFVDPNDIASLNTCDGSAQEENESENEDNEAPLHGYGDDAAGEDTDYADEDF